MKKSIHRLYNLERLIPWRMGPR